ncbi:MAG: transposase [Lachnospiraceae bacterium]|nr:transposase [Lachnospiraceae bacterium]
MHLENSISSFFSKYHIGNLLCKCNANKEKGVPVIRIFTYKLCNVFKKASMYMQMKTDSYHESFSKNTYYRFLNSAKTNWLRFTSLLSKAVANTTEPLTSDDRINAFVINDSLFERTSGKHTELASKVFDHCSMKFKTGYRLMTLGWTDGNTFLPVNSTLLASSKACNQYCQERSFDGRSIAAHRRKLAQMKGTDARWQIEIFIKTCKSTLNLIGECHSLSYNALTAHVAIVFARYLMIAIEQRKSEDYRTLGEIFYFLSNELEDITFRRSMQILMDAMIASIGEIFNVSNEQLSAFMTDFVSRLPIYLQEALSKIQAAA